MYNTSDDFNHSEWKQSKINLDEYLKDISDENVIEEKIKFEPGMLVTLLSSELYHFANMSEFIMNKMVSCKRTKISNFNHPSIVVSVAEEESTKKCILYVLHPEVHGWISSLDVEPRFNEYF